LTLAVLAAQIGSSLVPPSGSCSACGDLLVDDATVAGIAFRWGFTNLGRFARDYTGPIRRNPVDDPPPAHAVALAGAAAGQLARRLADARRVTAKVPCRGAAQATATRPCPLALVAGALGS
jgi:hypothetical protein